MLANKSKIAIWIFDNKETLLKFNRILINLVSIAVFGFMVFRYGFKTEGALESVWIYAIRSFYLFFALNFIFRFSLNKEKLTFIKDNWVEAALMGLVFINTISYVFFPKSQLQKLTLYNGGGESMYEFSLLFMLLIFAFIEFIKSINFIASTKIKPTVLFVLSYIILILIGSGLLMLPGFNTKYVFLNFFDALFNATSAACITGLSTLNIGEFFNFKGQVLILILIQIGGIGIISFAAFFATFIKKGLGIKHQIIVNELFNNESLSGSFNLLKRVLGLMFGIEIIGSVVLYFLWESYPFESTSQRIYYSIFHTISAFCNAGFSLFPSGFETKGISNLYLVHWFLSGLIFLGSLGFPAIRDIFSPTKLRERLNMPWQDWKTSTKIAVYTSSVLSVIGFVAYYYLSVSKMSEIDKGIGHISVSIFQSMNLRSCGMSAIDIGQIPIPLVMISMFLMFIGGSSSSTAGGIKTSTFIVAFTAILGTIRGKKDVVLGKRTISTDIIYRAFAVILFSGNFILLFATILTFTENDMPFIKLLFETVSAFTNVGLSMGITSELSDIGKIILSISMLAGRVGLLTFAFSLSSKVKSDTIKYPKTHITIG
jgi:trk system potassium uptake protein